MKKFILLLIILTSGIMAAGQTSIFLTYRPVDIGIGARIDWIKETDGIYVAYSRGEYNFGEGDIMNHNNYGIGWVHNIEDYSFISLGVSYDQYSDCRIPENINKKAFKPVSIDLGTGIRIEWFIISLRMDIIKWDPCLGIGITF